MDDPRMETMQDLMAYLPGDRLGVLARQNELPEHTSGTVVLADISGFTHLTEALAYALGPRRGAEELAHQMNHVYDPLIAAVDRYSGSVVGFSGDGMTCWFDGDSGLRATASALAMQTAMQTLDTLVLPGGASVSLALKVAIAGGAVRRFRVGDPAIQVFDVLAGAPLDRVATAERLASPGEVVLDAQVRVRLPDDSIVVLEQRADLATHQMVYVVGGLTVNPEPQPMPPLDPVAFELDQLRHWVLPAVYERLMAGLGEFLAELRPATSLFLRFSGIDFDADEAAGEKLDAFVGWVQRTIGHYGGTLLDVTVGDKGSYLSAAFGAPIAHHDDARRAALAALELRSLPSELAFTRSVQIGIGRGLMYAGATGGTTRRTYCLRGDEVNLAARLMQAAAPGEILVSQAAHQATGDTLEWTSLAPLRVKGKSAPVPVFRLLGVREQRRQRLQEPRSTLPLVGREAELALLEQQLERALGGHGQLVAVRAEAGMGKSRLVAEVLQAAAEQQIVVYLGECLAYGGRSSYQAWTPIWSAIFDLDADASPAEQIQRLERQLGQVEQRLVPRLPLLGAVLNLPIPETKLTASLDTELRKASLDALLVDCLQARARQGPLLIVLEDCHWIDPLSQDLLETVARAIVDLPVLIVTTERPLETEHMQSTRIAQLRHRTDVFLTQLTQQDARQLAALKLRQVTGVNALAVPGIVERILARAEGNPFYIEELVQYLHAQKVNLHDPLAVAHLDVPTSLHSLILGRIDQLTERQKMTLKVASVVGRVFRVSWLWGVHPQLGERPGVQADLEQLSRLDLTPIEQVEPELTYLFKHVVTRDVVYESMPTAMRTVFHGQLGGFIEGQFTGTLTQVVDLLAYHYDLSDNTTKRREYLRKAGDAAKSAYANQSAVDYYQRLLPLLSPAEQSDVMRELGEVWQLTGKWPEAEEMYRGALELAEQAGDEQAQALSGSSLGRLLSYTESYDEALSWLQQAQSTFKKSGNDEGMSRTLGHLSFVYWQLGEYQRAFESSEHQLRIATAHADQRGISDAHENIGVMYLRQGDHMRALYHLKQASNVATTCGYQRGSIVADGDTAGVYFEQGDFAQALNCLRHALNVANEIGYLHAASVMIGNAGEIYRLYGDYDRALACYGQALQVLNELGAWTEINNNVSNIATVYVAQGRMQDAEGLLDLLVARGRALHNPYCWCEDLYRQADLYARQQRYAEAYAATQEAIAIASDVHRKDILVQLEVLAVRLRVALHQAEPQAAICQLEEFLGKWPDDSEQALLRYEIWRLDATRSIERYTAAALYKELYARTPNVAYRENYQALTGETLPDPAPLPSFSGSASSGGEALEMLLKHWRVASSHAVQPLS